MSWHSWCSNFEYFITIVFGNILVLSNFIPTIYFGVFTGIAMLLAMISVLTLLPKLILTYKPFGDEVNNLLMPDFIQNLADKLNLFDIFFLIILFYNVIQCFTKGFSIA